MSVEKLLPIGSVVLVKEAEKRLMIIGIMAADQETGIDYDYLAVPYPEGYISDEYRFLFNHEDIDEMSFYGFVDQELQSFRAAVHVAEGME